MHPAARPAPAARPGVASAPAKVCRGIQNQARGRAKTTPISRPHRRWMYSSQKISLNSAIVKPRLINLPCGEERYFCSSACHAASDSGGSQPVTGRHSTIESPDSVSRVSAPMTIIKKIIAATTISQLRTDAGTGCMSAGPCVNRPVASSGISVANSVDVLRLGPALSNRFAHERITPRATRIFLTWRRLR